jgi:soluble lytic murein transglycosylase-like protein
MTLMKRLRLGVSAFACSAAIATAGGAATPQALTTSDAQRYAAAFEATDRGDFIGAQMQTIEVQDKSLLGYLSFRALMHPTAHKAAFSELAGWLARFRDLPVADRIFALAAKRMPAEAASLPSPAVALADDVNAPAAVTDRGRAARQAFYAGDARRALRLAPAAGEPWIAGLAAYRLKAYDRAQGYFAQLADDALCDPWLRSAAGYWAARSAQAQGDSAAATGFLQAAAQTPHTFYGMIAQRQLRLVGAPVRAAQAADNPQLFKVSFAPPPSDLAVFMQSDIRAHRAAALAQLGRVGEAAQELRAGLLLARSPEEREHWMSLGVELGTQVADGVRTVRAIDLDFPTPALTPKSGFTIDKALVYAIVRQESRFNPMAVSPVGATGLMQLMPEAAARAAGDDKLKADMSPLFDPAFNLRVGQDYITWLMERGVGYDILQTVAAYNGGPGTLLKTAQMLGDDADSLMIIECLPSVETRNYVEKVMAGYWTYRKMWGEDSPTLSAIAGGARYIDARLDLGQSRSATAQISTQPLQVGMR